MMRIDLRKALAVIAMTTGISGHASAGLIAGLDSVSGAGLGTATGASTTANANNDNTGAGATGNRLSLIKTFTQLAPIEMVFDVLNTGGTTEYSVGDSVQNMTGQAWGDFTLILGFTNAQGQFVPLTRGLATGLGLDFDTPNQDPMPSSSVFGAPLIHDSNLLAWKSATAQVPNGGLVSFDFRLDIPDNISTLHPDGFSEFTIQQIPSPVPEPSTLLLIGGAIIGLLAALRWGGTARTWPLKRFNPSSVRLTMRRYRG